MVNHYPKNQLFGIIDFAVDKNLEIKNQELEIGAERLYSSFAWMPRSQRTASFLYLLSPRELILIAGSLPLLPQRLIVRGETLKICATSRTVSKSGRLFIEICSAISIYYVIDYKVTK